MSQLTYYWASLFANGRNEWQYNAIKDYKTLQYNKNKKSSCR